MRLASAPRRRTQQEVEPSMSVQHTRALSRRTFLGAAAGLATAAALARPARAQTRVQIGYLPLLSVGPLFLAYEQGYLRDGGLDVEMVRFNSGAEMVVALGTGELAAGYGVISPGLLNAWTRGVGIRLVADGSRLLPGYGYVVAVVRTDLVDTIRGPADLRGRRLGMSVVGSAVDYMMRNLLEQGGLTLDDVDVVRISSADVTAGLAGRSLDAGGVAEPHGALADQTGAGRLWLTGDQIVPGMQVSGLLISEQTGRDRALAVALVTAWLRGVRDFLPGQTSDQAVLDALGRWTGVPTDVIRRAVPTYLDPNGAVDLGDLRRQQDFWLRHGVITAPAPLEAHVDGSYADAAVQTLGRAGT